MVFRYLLLYRWNMSRSCLLWVIFQMDWCYCRFRFCLLGLQFEYLLHLDLFDFLKLSLIIFLYLNDHNLMNRILTISLARSLGFCVRSPRDRSLSLPLVACHSWDEEVAAENKHYLWTCSNQFVSWDCRSGSIKYPPHIRLTEQKAANMNPLYFALSLRIWPQATQRPLAPAASCLHYTSQLIFWPKCSHPWGITWRYQIVMENSSSRYYVDCNDKAIWLL